MILPESKVHGDIGIKSNLPRQHSSLGRIRMFAIFVQYRQNVRALGFHVGNLSPSFSRQLDDQIISPTSYIILVTEITTRHLQVTKYRFAGVCSM